MAASASEFVAGHYTSTWNAVDLGKTEVGFSLRPMWYKEDIRIDDFGDTTVDGIFRGANVRLSFELIQWGEAGVQNLVWHYMKVVGTTPAIGSIDVAKVGQPIAEWMAQLVLTPVSAVNLSLKTYTFPLCAPDTDHGAFNLNSRLRRATCNLIVYPNLTTGVLFTSA